MICTECGATIAPSATSTVRSRRCGDVYYTETGRRVYPALHMYPVTHPRDPGYPLSKWMLPWTRPLMPGMYHVRFTSTEPRVLLAWWDGANFVNMQGERVCMTDFLSWRGVLA